MAFELDKRRTFGSLHTGRDVSSLRDDECPVFRNVQHDVDGRTRKRRGYALSAELASISQPDEYHLEWVNDAAGLLTPGNDYGLRITHCNGLGGETDLLQVSSGLFTGAGDNAADVYVEFHLRKMAVKTWHELPSTTPGLPDFPVGATTVYMLELENGPPASILGTMTDPYAGFLLYSRAPRIQDQTRLGANPDADDPLYHRREPLAKIHAFGTYGGNPVFVLDREVPQLGQTGKVDRDTVDIMMPDRNGLPAMWFNVYLSESPYQDWRLAGTGTSGATPVRVLSYDSTADQSPLTRIARNGPVLSAADATDSTPNGGTVPADTGIKGGVYQVRGTWTLSDLEVQRAPGWETAAAALGLGGRRPTLRGRQESYPWRCRILEVQDGQEVTVQRAVDPMPDTVAGWNVYIKQSVPYATEDYSTAGYTETDYTLESLGTEIGGVYTSQLPNVDPGESIKPRSVTVYWTGGGGTSATDDGNGNIGVGIFSGSINYSTGLISWSPGPSGDLTADYTIWEAGSWLDEDGPAAEFGGDGIADLDSAPGEGEAGFQEYWNSSGMPTQPATDPAARGYEPAYDQIGPLVEATDGVAADWKFASSDDTQTQNRHRFYYTINSNDGNRNLLFTLGTNVMFRLFLRVRPGNWSDYDPADNERVKIRRWDNQAQQWVVLKEGLSPSGGFVEHRIPLGISDLDDLFQLEPPDSGFKTAVFDVVGENGVGFDICQPELDVFVLDEALDAATWLIEAAHVGGEILQEEDLTETSVTFRHPLADERWSHRTIRENNTTMWPVQLFGNPVPNKRGPASQVVLRIAGIGDSIFEIKPSGTLERLWQYEGLNYAEVVQDDFQFCNYLWRLFACNPGLAEWNIRWDQQQAYPMGLETPTEKGEIAAVSEPAPGPDVTEDVEIEYYLVGVRKVEGGNGYIVRSAPVLFTDTARVNLRDGFESACRVEGTITPEPQWTHVELYRNLVDRAFYKRAVEIPINAEVVNADGTVSINYNDVFNGTDDDLDIELQFDTGRPPPSKFWIFHRGRVHGVGQEDGHRAWFSNIKSPSGLENPEGWYVLNVNDPPLKVAGAITCLSGADGPLRISTLRGMARADELQIADGVEAFSLTAINADTGWIGPRAWAEIDDIEVGMTAYGPAQRVGDQLEFIGSPGYELVQGAHLDARTAYGSWVVQDPDGRIWLAFSDHPVGQINGQLVLARQKLADGIQPYWAEWRVKHAHSSDLLLGMSGRQQLWLGGHDGRIYRYGGRHRTDAGLFIPCAAASRPERVGQSGAARPDYCYWFLHGDRMDAILVKVRKDMERQRAYRETPQRIACNTPPVDSLDNSIPDFGVGTFVPGDGTEYGLEDAWFSNERMTRLGSVYRQIQFEVYQELEEMPVGTRREAGMDLGGYVLTAQPRGRRTSR